MKKTVKPVIAICLTLTMLCACGAKDTATETTANQNVKPDAAEEALNEETVSAEANQTEAGVPRTVEELVGESFTYVDTIHSVDDYDYEVDFHLPEILLDCPGAKEINAAIQDDCGDIEQQISEDYPTWWQSTYEAYLNGDVLSICLVKRSMMDDYAEYFAYNLDIVTGNMLKQQDLARRIDMDEDTLLKAIRKTAVYQADVFSESMFGSDYFTSGDIEEQYAQEMYTEMLQMRLDTISEKNITMNIPMYLGENGILYACIPIYVMAGAGVYTHVCEVQMQSNAVDMQFSFDDAVEIRYQNGEMTIKMEESDWTRNTFATKYLEFGKEYAVDGVYKDYASGGFLLIHQGDDAIPVFISDDGLVSYIDIYSCADAGYFCMTEVAYLASGFDEIAEENAEKLSKLVENAISNRCSSFSRKTLDLYENEGFSTETTYTTEAGESYTSNYYFGFDMEDENKLLYQDYVQDSDLFTGYEGKCTYLGMNEKGMICAFDVEDPVSGEKKQGAFCENRRGEWDEAGEDWLSWIDYTSLSGDDLFGSGDTTIQMELGVG